MPLLAVFLPVLLSTALPLRAQGEPEVIAPVEELGFSAPESWAMKYFSSASVMTSLGPIARRELGALDVGVEGVWVPSLSAEQRTVGFGGFKEEDLNRTDLFGRVRVRVGVGGGVTLEVGVTPPVTMNGVEARLWSAALSRPFFEGNRWSLGWRLLGQTGTARGDLVCNDEDLATPPGTPGNEFGCQARSRDEVQLDHYGAELGASVRVARQWSVQLAGYWLHHDLQFQIDALTFDFRDRTRLLTEGDTWAASAGATVELGSRLHLSGELFYTPLDRRPTRNADVIHDELLNVRGLLTYRVR